MNIPSDLKYTAEHEWLKDNGDGTVTIGITDFAQGELGDIVFVEINDVDTVINKEEPFGTVEAVKTVSELFAPVSGTIIEINSELEDSPELINEDCYGAGWLIKAKISNPNEIVSLMNSKAYEEIIA